MCGRLAQTESFEDLAARFEAENLAEAMPIAGDNVPPTSRIAAVALGRDRRRKLIRPLWSMVGRDGKPIRNTFNARDDRLMSSKLWRPLLEKGRRCLIPFDCFYEWKKTPGSNRSKPISEPFTITAHTGNRLHAFAGLYGTWRAPVPEAALGPGQEQPIELCATIITTSPNRILGRLHDRMPVILQEDDFLAWLGETPASEEDLLALLRPLPDELTDAEPGTPFQSRPTAGGPMKSSGALPI